MFLWAKFHEPAHSLFPSLPPRGPIIPSLSPAWSCAPFPLTDGVVTLAVPARLWGNRRRPLGPVWQWPILCALRGSVTDGPRGLFRPQSSGSKRNRAPAAEIRSDNSRIDRHGRTPNGSWPGCR
jgi:hypothetical protein